MNEGIKIQEVHVSNVATDSPNSRIIGGGLCVGGICGGACGGAGCIGGSGGLLCGGGSGGGACGVGC